LIDLRSFQGIIVATSISIRDIEHREIMLFQYEVHEQPAYPAVAIGKGMNRHELQMR
jgi:hypothetical protein